MGYKIEEKLIAGYAIRNVCDCRSEGDRDRCWSKYDRECICSLEIERKTHGSTIKFYKHGRYGRFKSFITFLERDKSATMEELKKAEKKATKCRKYLLENDLIEKSTIFKIYTKTFIE